MDEKEQKQLLMDLDVVMRSSDCPYIVQFYGALFREVRLGAGPRCLALLVFMADCWKISGSSFQGDCWICMELMATSLDKFYKYVYCVLDDVIPEEILGKITLAVSVWLFFFFQCDLIFIIPKTEVTFFLNSAPNRPLKH